MTYLPNCRVIGVSVTEKSCAQPLSLRKIAIGRKHHFKSRNTKYAKRLVIMLIFYSKNILLTVIRILTIKINICITN